LIVFHSLFHGQTGKTSGMLAIGLYMAFAQGKRILVMSLQDEPNVFECAVLGYENQVMKRLARDIGLAALMRNIKAGTFLSEDITEYCIKAADNFYLTIGNIDEGTKVRDFIEFIKKIEMNFDEILIDVPNGKNDLSDMLLNLSDVNVLCIDQNAHVINRTFQEYVPALWTKTYILTGMYINTGVYLKKNISKIVYDKVEERSGYMYFDQMFRDAFSEGDVVDFIRKRILTEEKDDFMKNLAGIVDGISRVAE